MADDLEKRASDAMLMAANLFWQTVDLIENARQLRRDTMKIRARSARLRRRDFHLYFSTSPPPKRLEREQLESMMPARSSTREGALHGAALVIRGGQYPWLMRERAF